MKKYLGIMAIAAIAAAAGWNFNQSQNELELSDLALANAEALARGENPYDCPNGCLTSPGSCFCHFYFPYEEAN